MKMEMWKELCKEIPELKEIIDEQIEEIEFQGFTRIDKDNIGNESFETRYDSAGVRYGQKYFAITSHEIKELKQGKDWVINGEQQENSNGQTLYDFLESNKDTQYIIEVEYSHPWCSLGCKDEYFTKLRIFKIKDKDIKKAMEEYKTKIQMINKKYKDLLKLPHEHCVGDILQVPINNEAFAFIVTKKEVIEVKSKTIIQEMIKHNIQQCKIVTNIGPDYKTGLGVKVYDKDYIHAWKITPFVFTITDRILGNEKIESETKREVKGYPCSKPKMLDSIGSVVTVNGDKIYTMKPYTLIE